MSETANAIYQAEHEAFKSLRDEVSSISCPIRPFFDSKVRNSLGQPTIKLAAQQCSSHRRTRRNRRICGVGVRYETDAADYDREVRTLLPQCYNFTSIFFRCEFSVLNGRHPTVELGLLTSGRLFVPNDVVMDESSALHVITGPNMAGEWF